MSTSPHGKHRKKPLQEVVRLNTKRTTPVGSRSTYLSHQRTGTFTHSAFWMRKLDM